MATANSARELAVEIVDGVSGYTIERSPHRETHAHHYDMVEDRLEEIFRRAEASEKRCEELEAALKPFVEDIENWTGDHGWAPYAPSNDRICDWFGPSDFRRARAALSNKGEADGTG